MLLYLFNFQYLRSVKPLLEADAYARIEQMAQEFGRGEGRRLQKYLYFKYLGSANYVSDWWEEYVYLRGRSPIMVSVWLTVEKIKGKDLSLKMDFDLQLL